MRQSDWEGLGFDLVGNAAVDSGQIMIVDPCYILPTESDSGQLRGGHSYDEILDHYEQHDPEFRQPYIEPWGAAFGFISGTLYGDGRYPIYAKVDRKSKRFTAVLIDFDPEDDDDA